MDRRIGWNCSGSIGRIARECTGRSRWSTGAVRRRQEMLPFRMNRGYYIGTVVVGRHGRRPLRDDSAAQLMVLVRVAGCTRGTMESDAARVFVRDGRRTLC